MVFAIKAVLYTIQYETSSTQQQRCTRSVCLRLLCLLLHAGTVNTLCPNTPDICRNHNSIKYEFKSTYCLDNLRIRDSYTTAAIPMALVQRL